MKAKPIRTKLTIKGVGGTELGGWLHGRKTYLGIWGKNATCYGIIDGGKLYRLAKAIVRQFEMEG